MVMPKDYFLFIYRGGEDLIWTQIWADNDREAVDKTIRWIEWWKRNFPEDVFDNIKVELWADDWPHWHTKEPVWKLEIREPKRETGRRKLWFLDVYCPGGPTLVRAHIWARNEAEAIKRAMEWTRKWRDEFEPIGEVKGGLWEEAYPHAEPPIHDWWVSQTPILAKRE